jgi:hypothetical protein
VVSLAAVLQTSELALLTEGGEGLDGLARALTWTPFGVPNPSRPGRPAGICGAGKRRGAR